MACIYLLCLAFVLSACGSGGGDEDESVTSSGSGTNSGVGSGTNSGSSVIVNVPVVDASAAYIGLRAAAVLDADNSEVFMQTFFNLWAIDDLLDFSGLSVGLNQTASCRYGGTVSLAGSVTSGGTGTLVSTFVSCNEGDSILDGSLYTTVNAIDANQEPKKI